LNSSRLRALAAAAACAASLAYAPSLFARGAGGGGHGGGGHGGGGHGGGGHGGGHAGGHVGGAHVGGAHAHVGGVHHGGIHTGGGYYGGGIYRGGLYGIGGYGLGGYGLGGIGLGGYGLGSSYYGSGSYYSSGVGGYYSNSAPLLSPLSVGTPQVISLYPSTSDVPASVNRPALNANDGTGTIVVRVPSSAEVFWNGTPSIAGGTERLFGTLPLNPEGVIHRFEARWSGPNGQTITQSRDVRALPNQTVVVDFTAPVAPANPAPANVAPNPAPAVNPGVPALPPVPDPFK